MRFGSSEVWTQTTIGKIAKVVGGGTPETEKAEYWNGNIQWFTPSEVGQTKYIEKSEVTKSENPSVQNDCKYLETAGKFTCYQDTAVEYFKQGYNCAQSVFLAYADRYGFDKDTALRVSSSFGGGMGRLREVCGAVTAMFAIVMYEKLKCK